MSAAKIDLVRLGNNIKNARECSKLSQLEVATYLGVDQSFISKVEKGERALGADALERLASLLCCSLKDLLQSENVNPGGEIAFRTDGLTYEDNCTLANVNKIILNQIEMDGLKYGKA